MSGLRIVRAEGDAYTRGLAVGLALGREIDRSLAFHRERLAGFGLATRDLPRVLTPYWDAAEGALPDLAAQLRGMAMGADVDLWELVAMNALEELEPLLGSGDRSERCSTVTLCGSGATLLGHNEQWYAGDADSLAVVVELPTDGRPACASPTIACYLPAVGVNAHGVAQGVDSLTASDDGVGVPRVLVSRHALDARDRGDAMARAGMPGRAGGYAHVYATPSGEAFAVETTGRREALLDGPGAHTNHYLAPALADVADEASERSLGRHRRLGELLVDHDPTTPEQVMALLADHGGTPEAICRHPQAADGPDASVVLFSMVCDVQAGRMWVAPGNPCTTPFQEVDLGDVLASDTVR